jgi:hypothetical protein
MSKKLKGNKKVAKRNNVKLTRKFNGKEYKLVDEIEPISSTPDMFFIKDKAKSQGRSIRFVYNKTNDTGLVYFSTARKKQRKKRNYNGRKKRK